MSLAIQWMTFGLMIIIQTVAAVWMVSAIRTTLDVQGGEIKLLRERWHALAPKVMLVDAHEKILADHELRIRGFESLRSDIEQKLLEVESVRVGLKHGFSK